MEKLPVTPVASMYVVLLENSASRAIANAVGSLGDYIGQRPIRLQVSAECQT